MVVLEVEVRGRFGGVAGSVFVFDGCLPSLGCVIFREIIAKVNPRCGFAIETWKLHLVGCPFQRFCELGDGGTREVVDGAVHSARMAAGAMGGRGGPQGSRPSEVVFVLIGVLMHRGTKVEERFPMVLSGRRWGAVGLEPLELPVLLSNEASELVVREASSGRLFRRWGTIDCINIRIEVGIIRASIGRRIGIVVAGGLAVWVPVKIAKITILGSRIGSEGLMKRLLRGIQAMLLVKVLFRMSFGRSVLKSVGKSAMVVLQGRLEMSIPP